ncbi:MULTISPECIES: PilW family protein [Chromobacterium]|uniref:PilW family protein n=1 Tax=Chromobacterium TaxID=535 RepID=UPI0018892589|nr:MULTISPECIES: PilW family protein [Chromobacterium]QOZ81911.1 prepilin-type N-terminal cleavage/methylation domain-containing protein [Chromobacterium sp. Rain0013]WON81909.1 PilW family protein [Chromobacterium haemolyticum]
MANRVPSSKQLGLTLIELMIAITIGLMVSLAVASLYLSNQQTNKAQAGHAQMQDNGRFAMAQIGRLVRQAGFYDILGGTFSASGTWTVSMDASGNWAIPSLQASQVLSASNDVTVTSFNASNALSVLNGVKSDQFTITFMTGPQASTGNATPDCLGNSVTSKNTIVSNRFYIDVNTISGVTRPSLMCDVLWNGVAPSGSNLATGVVADNIERIQILLGVDSTGDGVADQFSPPSASIDMTQVVAMRVALLARTDPVYGQLRAEPAAFNMFGSNYVVGTDTGSVVNPLASSTVACVAATPCWSRRVFESTFTLRNRIP